RLRPHHDPPRQRVRGTRGRLREGVGRRVDGRARRTGRGDGRRGVRASLGVLALALGAVSALLGIVVLLVGLRRKDDRLLRMGLRYAFFVLGASAVAVVAMEWALISHDFSIRYVAENN